MLWRAFTLMFEHDRAAGRGEVTLRGLYVFFHQDALGSAPAQALIDRMLFEQVAGPTGADGAPGVFCCGLRVVSMDGSVTDVLDSKENGALFGRPSNQQDGTYLAELKPPRKSDGPVITVRVIEYTVLARTPRA